MEAMTLHESQLCRAEHPLVLATGFDDDIGIVMYQRYALTRGHFSYMSQFVREALIEWLQLKQSDRNAHGFCLSVKFGKIMHARTRSGGWFMKYLDADHMLSLRTVPNETFSVPDGAAVFAIDRVDGVTVRIHIGQISFLQRPDNMLGLVADAFIADRAAEGLRMAQEAWPLGWPLVAALCETNAVFAHAIESDRGVPQAPR